MKEDFEHWWDKEGQYSELCGKELCLIAWSNGEYKAQKELKISNDEIREIGDDCILKNNGLFNWIDFARAILRKASEK